MDVVFTPETVLEPDIIFVSRATLAIIGGKYLAGPPDLVVEVLSESSSPLDREIKPKEYARYGVPEFWRIDLEGRTVETFRLQGEEYQLAELLEFGGVLASPMFPGLSLTVSSLWESM